MVLRICAILSLMAVLATAQTDAENSTDMMGMNEVDLMANLTEQFMGEQSTQERRRHFYCLGPNENRANFPFDEVIEANGETGRVFTWAVFLQYPVLSYLDSVRKEYLFQVILRLANSQSDGRLRNLNTSDICISRVFHYRVSEYEESVLVNVYFRRDNGIVVSPYDSTDDDRVSITEFNTYFMNAVNRANPSGDPGYVRIFRDRRALAVESVAMDMNSFSMTEMNVHPFGRSDRGADALEPNQDPTLRAVYINSYVGYRDLSNATYEGDEFASNPRPINLGLEAGDIVFIVFGCFFLAILLALTVLGFCIHPFFLA